ncbi:MAG TPA: J domain-containing protein [Dehalococcoidia bacterium]|nr:J domain-containing protein [Dehalococcoidia bacterium]
MENLYAILGVETSASAEEIRAAYRSLAQRFHPDHNPHDLAAAQRMQEINEAFAVLNAPERRRAYDATLAAAAPANGATPAHGAGRGQRPYFRGNNWGLHEGAEAPPEHIVRAAPGAFNLAVISVERPPARIVTLHSDAPFAVTLRATCSPWLEVSRPELEMPRRGSVDLTIAVTSEAARELRGWRDGGVSFISDDPRVYAPDVRVTTIFMAQGPVTAAQARPQDELARERREDDLRAASTEEPRGWLRRLFGG